MKSSILFILALALCTACTADTTTEEGTANLTPQTGETAQQPAPEDNVISYEQQLSAGSMNFYVVTTGTGTNRNLAIQVEREGQQPSRIDEPIEGTVTGSVTTDLNENTKPELLVFVAGGGSGSYGKVYGYEFEREYWGELSMPDLAPALQEGYRGHDEFKVQNNRLLRTFPVYHEADPNCCPTGGTRTIVYSLDDALTLQAEQVL
ncbi:MAG: hypothetical protein LPK07_13215 [Hymenobacteraceae bacterium]|nr:hypothetical protein [Hymenobacteraceae bacterium]